LKEKEIVVAGWGKTSTLFSHVVRNHLEKNFGFKVIMPPNLADMRKLYLDNENRVSRPAKEVLGGDYKGKIVYLTQDTRIYDSYAQNLYRTLLINAKEWERNIARLRSRFERETLNGVLDQMYTLLNELKPLVTPDFESKTGSQMIIAENLPDRQLRKARSMIEFFNDAGAAHICYATRKSSYEWNHNHEKALHEKGLWETHVLKQVIQDFSIAGAHSLIYLHEHARKEMPELTKESFLNFTSINPQEGLIKINGMEYDMIDYLTNKLNIPRNNIDFDLLLPFDKHLNGLKESEPGIHKEFFVDCVDEGAYHSSKRFAERNGLRFLEPLEFKFRNDEGSATGGKAESLDKHLDDLVKRGIKKADIYVILPDDKFNTGGSGDGHAYIRNQEGLRYNEEHSAEGVEFNIKVVMDNTHMRAPYIHRDLIKVHNLHQVVVLDTVPYSEALDDQLIWHNLDHKIKVLHGPSAYLISTGIAIEYDNIGKKFLTETHKKVILTQVDK